MSGWGYINGFGQNGYDAAKSDRRYGGQPNADVDINDIYAHDGYILGARGAHLLRNNAITVALINGFQEGINGAEGLKFKSQYSFTDNDEDNRKYQDDIESCIKRGCADTRLDAAGLLTKQDIENQWITDEATYGESIWVRVHAPTRPGACHEHAWRGINPLRISNPNYKPNDAKHFNGIHMGPHGPLGIWIASRHPNKIGNDGESLKWNYAPLFDKNGERQVIWKAWRTGPEQIRGTGWLAPVMGLIIHLGKVVEAHVIAKRLQACLGMVIETPDPVAAARADRNGTVFTENTKIEPGRTYYIKTGSRVTPFDFKYDGKDFEDFTSSLLQLISAGTGTGIPWQYAFRQLTKSNMASARAALMQAWRSFRRHQIKHEYHLRTIYRALLAEDIARGRLVLPSGDDLDAAIAGYFVPPQRLVTDEHREMQAAEKKHQVLGVSKTTLSREAGYDQDAEREQRKADQSADDAAGLLPVPAAEEAPAIEHDEHDDPDDIEAEEEQLQRIEKEAA